MIENWADSLNTVTAGFTDQAGSPCYPTVSAMPGSGECPDGAVELTEGANAGKCQTPCTRPLTWQCPTCGPDTGTSNPWTYNKCYKAGTPCPLNHEVCAADNCAMDEWREIAQALRDAGCAGTDNVYDPATKKCTDTTASKVKVLGFLETRDEKKPNEEIGAARDATATGGIVADLNKYKNGDGSRTTGVAM